MSSRYNKKPLVIMEKPKTKITKKIQLKYPAPYSQSWSGPTQSSTKASTNRSATQKLGCPRREVRPQPRYRGPDPTVPHLKYGLFPKRSRGQSRTMSSSAPQESDTSEAKKQRTVTPKEDAPLFVVRALDARLTRRLSRAASTHLDIKPRNTTYLPASGIPTLKKN